MNAHDAPRILVSALVCVAALASATAPAVTLTTTRVVVKGGDASPDGTGSLSLIVPPIVLGASRQVAFSSDIRDQGFLGGFGIFRCSNPADLVLIARSSAAGSGPVTGWPAPDGNGYFYPFDDPPLAINASGQVAFGARLTGTFDPSEAVGVFRGSGGQAGVVQIARGNELVPGGSDVITGLTIPSLAPSLNDSGEVAFNAAVGAPSPDGQAILRGDGTPGSLVEIVRTHLAGAPEIPLTITKPTPLNQAGAVGFAGCFVAGCGGIFRGDGGDLTEIASAGEASPDGNGSFGIDVGFRAPAFNDSGEAAFFTMLSGTTGGSSDNAGLFRGDGASLAAIARRGDLTPGGNGRLLDINSIGFALNDLGQVLFVSTITGAVGGSSAGVFRGDGGALLTIARIGDPAPGGPGVFSDFQALTLALNDNGQAVFKASIDLGDGGSANDTEGLFFFDDVRGLRAVARLGDVVPGAGIVQGLDFTGGTTMQGEGTSGLNGQGYVAYRLGAGGSYYVAIAPEPDPAELGVAAGLALLGRSRRATRRRRRSATGAA